MHAHCPLDGEVGVIIFHGHAFAVGRRRMARNSNRRRHGHRARGHRSLDGELQGDNSKRLYLWGWYVAYGAPRPSMAARSSTAKSSSVGRVFSMCR